MVVFGIRRLTPLRPNPDDTEATTKPTTIDWEATLFSCDGVHWLGVAGFEAISAFLTIDMIPMGTEWIDWTYPKLYCIPRSFGFSWYQSSCCYKYVILLQFRLTTCSIRVRCALLRPRNTGPCAQSWHHPGRPGGPDRLRWCIWGA